MAAMSRRRVSGTFFNGLVNILVTPAAYLNKRIQLSCRWAAATLKTQSRQSADPERTPTRVCATRKTDFTTVTTRVKWTAQLDHVQEVSILGSADLGFWRKQLAGEELTPVDREGRANILIVSAVGKYMGVRFRELSVSVSVASEELTSYFLIRAFNSNSFFAFCERVLFSAPYDCANVGIVHDVPTEISVTQRGRTLFSASMRRTDTSATRTPTREFEEAFVTRINLPGQKPSTSRAAKMFFARLGGRTQVYPFIAGEDTIVINPKNGGDSFGVLSESAFVPEAWMIRSNASHAKSKTYKRGENVEFERCGVDEPVRP